MRKHVDFFYDCLPTDYLHNTNRSNELRLIDDRIFSDSKNRYIDASFMSCASPLGGTIVVEFKRGVLTAEMVKECGWYRGYFSLCYNQIPNFKWFTFVAEEIKPEAREICSRTSRNNEKGIKISFFAVSPAP